MNTLKDANGKDSSKRLAGFITGGSGLLMLIAVGVCSFFYIIADPSTAFNAGLTLLSVGGTLLGVGTFEKRVKEKTNIETINTSYRDGSGK